MRAEANTPDRSEERGDFSSAEPSSEEETEQVPEDPLLPPLCLWVLDLTLEVYVMWNRPAYVQSHATMTFQRETNPEAITWPVWWTIEQNALDDDDRGVIPVVDNVVMLKCDVTTVLFEDGIIRNVFVVWLIQEETGQERRMALIRGRVRPAVTAWPERKK